MNLEFIRANDLPGSILRSEVIARHLGVPCHVNRVTVRDGTAVFVKSLDHATVRKAKGLGNLVVYDPLDLLCYGDRWKQVEPVASLLDVIIVYNKPSILFYKTLFPNAAFVLIPHQWDPRITDIATQDGYKPAYIGNKFNLPFPWMGDCVFDAADWVPAASRYNLHIAGHQKGARSLLKPAVKVANAAAALAHVVSYRDPSVVELLGPDYPYYVDDDPRETLVYAEQTFGTTTWAKGLEIMSKVKERTSLEAVAKLYEELAIGSEHIQRTQDGCIQLATPV